MAFTNGKIILPFLVLTLFSLSFLFMITSDDLLSAISEWSNAFGDSIRRIPSLPRLLIRNLPQGKTWILFLIVTTGLEISRHLGGVLDRSHKLYPKISRRRRRGLAGRFWIRSRLSDLQRTLHPSPPDRHRHSRGLHSGLLGQLGDLTESMLKRSAQVKDSGVSFQAMGDARSTG